jgi:Lhr-like helicase
MDPEPMMASFHPAVRKWFCSTFTSITEPQSMAFPLIKNNENILLLSPTGSGKTLAGFLVSIDHLVTLAEKEKLENRVYVIYVSPLRALSNDIKKNLMIPLKGIKKEAPWADIRVLVRTGDTSKYRKSKMLKESPHILITTPETLQIILNAPKFKEKLTNVKYVIVDEIHDLCNTKRGVSLSLSLERLQNLAGPFVRIGLSATQAPVEDIAQFLVGTHREARILIAEKEKKYDLEIVKPASLSQLSLEKAVEETYDILKELIESHNVTIVFSNTRSRTERIVYQLKKRDLFSVAAHHGSMGKEARHEIEDLLKQGKIKAVVTSTSLELGIDIGDVDLVVQLGTPKNTAKLMQRIGRAGHGLHAVSKGVLIAQNRDELVELEILKRKAQQYQLEPVQIPQNCLDVLAQHLIGLSLEDMWEAQDAYQLVRRSYCYRSLSYRDFVKTLEYLGGYYADLEEKHIYRKLWFDGERFGRVKAALYLYFVNCGTIPSQATFKVILEGAGIPLGKLSEYFVSHLKPDDIFILGGRSLQFVRVEGMSVLVKDALGGKPTVPSWQGEAMSRSFEFGYDLSEFRKGVFGYIDDKNVNQVDTQHVYQIPDTGTVVTPVNAECTQVLIDPDIISYFKDQYRVAGFIPTANVLYIEKYIDKDNRHHLIFHAPFGRRVNEALARAYTHVMKCTDFTVTDNGFMLTSEKQFSFKKGLVPSEEFIEIMKEAVWGTELFCQRFRHCAERGFLLLRNYKGKAISPRTQYYRARSLLKELPFDFPLVKETFNEVLYSALDCYNAAKILQEIECGDIKVEISDYTSIPSPFALSIVMAGAQDIITLKDRSEFLQHMQKAITDQIIEKTPLFDPDVIKEFYEERVSHIDPDTLLQKQIIDVLYTGVYSAAEIASQLHIDIENVESVVDTLIEENVVSCGYFTASELQYMLVKDRRKLEHGEGIEDKAYKAFLVKKHFDYTDCQKVFSAYGGMRSKRAVYDRVGFFSADLIRIKVGGRLMYIRPEDAYIFASAYQRYHPDEDLLEFIENHPGLTKKEIREYGPGINRLEENVYVYRDQKNRFYALDTELISPEKAQKEIIKKYIESCGPVTTDEISYYTGIKDVEEFLSDYKKVKIFSKVVQTMYCTQKDLDQLKECNLEDISSFTVRIIDYSDPLFDKLRYEISSELQEHVCPVVCNGQIIGGITYSGGEHFCIEKFIPLKKIPEKELFSEIQRVYKYYRWQGAHTMVIKDEYLQEMVHSLGYTTENGTFIDTPNLSGSPQEVYSLQLKSNFLLDSAPVETVLKIPFLTKSALQNRITKDVSTLIKNDVVTQVDYNGQPYCVLPEDVLMYKNNDIPSLVTRVLESFKIVTPFQVKNLVSAEVYHIETILKSAATPVFHNGELHYTVQSEFLCELENEILFLDETDPFIKLHNKKWNISGTAIIINGIPAGYYTTDENQADLILYKEFKEYWGNILVKLPSENIVIRSVNKRPVKDTRFARTFS